MANRTGECWRLGWTAGSVLRAGWIGSWWRGLAGAKEQTPGGRWRVVRLGKGSSPWRTSACSLQDGTLRCTAGEKMEAGCSACGRKGGEAQPQGVAGAGWSRGGRRRPWRGRNSCRAPNHRRAELLEPSRVLGGTVLRSSRWCGRIHRAVGCCGLGEQRRGARQRLRLPARRERVGEPLDRGRLETEAETGARRGTPGQRAAGGGTGELLDRGWLKAEAGGAATSSLVFGTGMAGSVEEGPACCCRRSWSAPGFSGAGTAGGGGSGWLWRCGREQMCSRNRGKWRAVLLFPVRHCSPNSNSTDFEAKRDKRKRLGFCGGVWEKQEYGDGVLGEQALDCKNRE